MIEFINAYYEPLLILLVGIICLALGILKRQQKAHLLKNGVKTTGIVIDYKSGQHGNSNNIPIYYPIIEFEDKDDKLRQLTCSFGYSTKMYQVKQQVEIYYDNSDSKKFIINDNKTQLFDYIFPLLGSALLLYGIYYLTTS